MDKDYVEEEQSLCGIATVLFICLLPFSLRNDILDIFRVLLGPNFWDCYEFKHYPAGCLERTSRFALTYYSGMANCKIPPHLLRNENPLISHFFRSIVFLAQCCSFFISAFPFILHNF